MAPRPEPTLYPSGEWPLVVLSEVGEEWQDWAAALYESYQADQEVNAGYQMAAQEVAEDLERAVYLAHGELGGDE